MIRGTMSKGMSRSAPASSPYTAKVIPTRRNSTSASARFWARRSAGISASQDSNSL